MTLWSHWKGQRAFSISWVCARLNFPAHLWTCSHRLLLGGWELRPIPKALFWWGSSRNGVMGLCKERMFRSKT